MKKLVFVLVLCAGTAVLLSACGDDSRQPEPASKAAAEKTAGSVEKTTDYLTGKKPLEQGRQAAKKLEKIQSGYNQKLEKELGD